MGITHYAEHLDHESLAWPEKGVFVAAKNNHISFMVRFTEETTHEDAKAWAEKHMEALKRKTQ